MDTQMSQNSEHSPMQTGHELWRHSLHIRTVGALLLIALGIVFLLQQVGILSHSGSWWVIFLLIPGLDILWNGLNNYRHTHSFAGAASVQLIGGTLLVLLSATFVFDPTWSFTRNWTLFRDFRLFSGINWDLVWPVAIILVGVWVFLGGRRRQ